MPDISRNEEAERNGEKWKRTLSLMKAQTNLSAILMGGYWMKKLRIKSALTTIPSSKTPPKTIIALY
jgi:hypothetical protein